MKRILSRSLAAAAVAAAAVGGILVAQAPAFAAAGDTASITPTSGNVTTALRMTTVDSCPADATNFMITIQGGNLGSEIIVNGNSDLSQVGSTPGDGAPMSAALSKNFDLIRQDAAVAQINAGDYTFTWKCIDLFNTTTYGTFAATVTVSTAMTATAGSGAWSYSSPVTKINTTTNVSATPASPAFGAPVTLSSHVTPSSGSAAATGSVQFSDGSGNIGSPVALDASGNASLTTTTLSSGAHSISAAFTGTGAFNNSSSTTPATVTVGNPPPGATTTHLTISPATVYASTSITLSMSETPAVAGSFTLSGFPGAPAAGIAASGGAASFSGFNLPAGTYSITATFTPTGNYTSSSDTQSLTVADKAPTQVATEYIDVKVKDGSLSITVQGFPQPVSTPAGWTPDPAAAAPTARTTGTPTNVVFLSDAQLNASATLITAAGSLIPVVVTDTRSGNLGYKVTETIGDFKGLDAANSTETINGQNLGWTPKFISSSRADTGSTGLVAGNPVAAANGASKTDAGTLGLKGGATLFTALAGHSNGQVVYGADLSLQAPTSTLPGNYEATMTLTANALP
jgi:hypothetical protein